MRTSKLTKPIVWSFQSLGMIYKKRETKGLCFRNRPQTRHEIIPTFKLLMYVNFIHQRKVNNHICGFECGKISYHLVHQNIDELTLEFSENLMVVQKWPSKEGERTSCASLPTANREGKWRDNYFIQD